MRPPHHPTELFRRLSEGDVRSLARAISIVEDNRPGADELASAAFRAAQGRIVGFTGSPGAGKSTVVDSLISHLRAERHRVAVVAVDPASPFTGGAILGDRIRMQRHIDDPEVFIRSMSNRGHLGGLASTTARVATLLGAAGYDPVLVETVGVGQSEVEVVDLAHVTAVVVAPGFGDGIQAVKAGVLEIGDLFVVNKFDLPGGEELARELRAMAADASRHPPVVEVVATQDRGIAEMWATVLAVEEQRSETALQERAVRLIRAAVRDKMATRAAAFELAPEIVTAVAAQHRDPWSTADRIVGDLLS